jgi:hypothetical protein
MKTMIFFFALLAVDILLINFCIFLFDKYSALIAVPLTLIILVLMILASIKFIKLTNNNNYEEDENEND